MTIATRPTMNEGALEAFRYRRRLLANRRLFVYDQAAQTIAETGRVGGSTKRKIRNIEREIQAYNAIAADYDLPMIEERE